MILIFQCLLLCLVVVMVLMWGWSFPYPSALIRGFLSPGKRWPEAQIREWLKSGRFQRSFLRYFYRDPERICPPGKDILAPADGRVTSAEVREGICYVVIALSFWDMHVQRSPISGTVVKLESLGHEYMDGEGREFAFLKEKNCPVQKRIVIHGEWGTLAVRLITSFAARRIETWVNEGQSVVRGERIARILLGSTVVIELPEKLQRLVKAGERVMAGETPVAKLPVTA